MTGGWVALRNGVAAQNDDSMNVLVWATREEVQAWCDARPKWHGKPSGWYPEQLIYVERDAVTFMAYLPPMTRDEYEYLAQRVESDPEINTSAMANSMRTAIREAQGSIKEVS